MEEQNQVRVTDRDVTRFINLLKIEAQGRKLALKASELKKRLGYSPRICRAIVSEANRLGTLIVGTNAGYYIPANRAEADESIGRLRSQGQKMAERADTQEQLAEQRFGNPYIKEEPDGSRQLDLFG